jgi:hypothetical protein
MHFIFNKCPIYTQDGASAKFSTNSYETYYSVFVNIFPTGKQYGNCWQGMKSRFLLQKLIFLRNMPD